MRSPLYQPEVARFQKMLLVLGGWLSFLPRLPRFSFFLASDENPGRVGGYLDKIQAASLVSYRKHEEGGVNRAKILELINVRPANANQIASELSLGYKSVVHHLRVLSENGLIVTDNKDTYGATYFLTPMMENNIVSFKEILDRIGKK